MRLCGGATRLAGHVAAARKSLGRRTHPARRMASPRTVLGAPPQPAPAVDALASSIEAAQGRPRASSSALRGCGSARHRCRSAHGASWHLKANSEPFRRGSSGLVSGLGVARASQCWQAARRHERPKSRAPAAWAG